MLYRRGILNYILAEKGLRLLFEGPETVLLLSYNHHNMQYLFRFYHGLGIFNMWGGNFRTDSMACSKQFCFSDGLTDQLHCTEDYNSHIDNIDCYSYEIQISVLHIIYSVPAKFDKLLTLISRQYQMNIEIMCFLICETCLTNNNANLYEIPGYTMTYKNRTVGMRGGIAIYIYETISFKCRPDIEINIDGEFESIFIETIIK